MSTAVWHRGHTFLSVIDTGPPSGGAIAARAAGGVGGTDGTGGGDGGCSSCLRARRSPKIRDTRSTTAVRTARFEEHTPQLQSRVEVVCRRFLVKTTLC